MKRQAVFNLLTFQLVTNGDAQRSVIIKGIADIAFLVHEYASLESTYLQSTESTATLEEAIRKLYYQILQYQARAACHLDRHRVSQAARNALRLDSWVDHLDDINKQHDKCKDLARNLDAELFRQLSRRQDGHFQELERLVNHQLEESSAQLRDINTNIIAIENSMVTELRAGSQETRDANLTKEMFECHRRFRTSDYKAHKNQNPVAINGTCRWVLENSKFLRWQSNATDDILWISADPGCGKSVLSRLIADQKRTDITVTYFFFKDGFEDQVSAAKALSALLHQIFSQNAALIEHALPAYRQNQKLSELTNELWEVLIAASEDPAAGEIWCLLDALDECQESDRHDLIELLNQLYVYTPRTNTKLKFLVTSRPYMDISRQLDSVIRLSGTDESATIKEEINLVIKLKVQHISNKLRFKKEDQIKFETALLAIENRTYLWLHLILKDLENSVGIHRWKTLETYLSQLPASVEDTYKKILEKSLDAGRLRKLLHIVLGAMRPLTIYELNVAVNIAGHKHCEELDLDSADDFKDDILYMSGLFLTIVDSKVYLIHQTAREFLLAPEDVVVAENTKTWKMSFAATRSDYLLAEACVTLLNLDHHQSCFVKFQPRFDNLRSLDTELIHYEFDVNILDDTHGSMNYYAREHWGHHFKQGDIHINSSVYLDSCDICKPQSKKFLVWRRDLRSIEPTELIIRSSSGHVQAVAAILCNAEVDANMTDRQGRTALHWAVECNVYQIAKLLLDKTGFDVNAADSDGRTALHLTTRSGRYDIAKLLLSKQAIDVNATDTHGWTTLYMAVMNGDSDMVKLLLNNQVIDVNAVSKIGWSALHLAAFRDDCNVAFSLIGNPTIDINAVTTEGMSALYLAVLRGHSGTAKLLLGNPKIDVNIADSDGWTALHFAALKGQSDMITSLLNIATVNVNAAVADGGTILHFAAEGGHSNIVTLLLDNAAMDVNKTNSEGWTALHAAANQGYSDVVRLLLENQALDMDITSKSGETARDRAVEHGHSEVVDLIDKHQAANTSV
jgi:ankyrin repeat protein